jgi:hypothetical protein
VPWYISILGVLRLKYLLAACLVLLLAFWALRETPNSYRARAGGGGVAYVNQVVRDMVTDLQRSCRESPIVRFFRGRECVSVDQVSGDIAELAIRGDFECARCQPRAALAKFQRLYPCLVVSDVVRGRVRIDLDATKTSDWIGEGGRRWKVCERAG